MLDDIKIIVRLGGSVSIDAAKFSIADIQILARLIKGKNSKLIIRNAVQKSMEDLKVITRLAPDNVIFEF